MTLSAYVSDAWALLHHIDGQRSVRVVYKGMAFGVFFVDLGVCLWMQPATLPERWRVRLLVILVWQCYGFQYISQRYSRPGLRLLFETVLHTSLEIKVLKNGNS